MSTVFITSMELLAPLDAAIEAVVREGRSKEEATLDYIRLSYNRSASQAGGYFKPEPPAVLTTEEVKTRIEAGAFHLPRDDFGLATDRLVSILMTVREKYNAKLDRLRRLRSMAASAPGLYLSPDDHELIYG